MQTHRKTQAVLNLTGAPRPGKKVYPQFTSGHQAHSEMRQNKSQSAALHKLTEAVSILHELVSL